MTVHIWVTAARDDIGFHVRTYCGQRIQHKKASVLFLGNDPSKADCPACIEARGQDQLEADWIEGRALPTLPARLEEFQ